MESFLRSSAFVLVGAIWLYPTFMTLPGPAGVGAIPIPGGGGGTSSHEFDASLCQLILYRAPHLRVSLALASFYALLILILSSMLTLSCSSGQFKFQNLILLKSVTQLREMRINFIFQGYYGKS